MDPSRFRTDAETRARLAAWGCLPPEIVLRCWEDPGYRERFLVAPRAALAEAGVELDAAVEIRVAEKAPALAHFVLPACPESVRPLDPKSLTPDQW